MPGVKAQESALRIADSSSINAVSFSSARKTQNVTLSVQSVSTRNSISGSPQIFSQFRFHLNRCFKRHWVQMFVKFWQQSDAIFPDDPSRFVAVFVIF